MIQFVHVTKRMGEQLLLNDISMDLKEGTVYGIAGTEDDGIRALLRVMTGVSRPDLGDVMCDGEKICDSAKIRQRIFFLPEESLLSEEWTISQILRLYQGYYPGFDLPACRDRLQDMQIDEKELTKKWTQKKKQRVKLALALSSGAKYLLLENIYSGFPAEEKKRYQSYLTEYARNNQASVILTGEDPVLLQDYVDCTGSMNEGNLLFSAIRGGENNEKG